MRRSAKLQQAIEPLTVACPHCGHGHRAQEQVRQCGLYRAGWRWRDANGMLASGPFTYPGGGLPVEPVTLQPPPLGQLELFER